MTVRLRHPKLHNVNFNVVHYRRYTVPFACVQCDEIHVFKTYHLKLDSDGEVEVSDEIYERLAELQGLPLKKMSKVTKPTPQRLEMPNLGQQAGIYRVRTESFVPKDIREMVKEN